MTLGINTLAPMTSATELPQSAFPTARMTLYVDCNTTAKGDGTSESSPLAGLSEINSKTLKPGTHVLFKRGVTCQGQFAPQGKGSAADPIIISDYGTDAARAKINANGQEQAVLLKNNEYLTLSSLELIAPGNSGQTVARRGVYLLGKDAGNLHGMTLKDLYIHDVKGYMTSTVTGDSRGFVGKAANASGGIVIDTQGSTIPTAFLDLQVIDNRLDNVDRQGIYMWSNWCSRPQLKRWVSTGDCSAQWYPNKDVLISNNKLTNVGGDGIVITNTDGALVERNTLNGFNMRARTYNAGMWVANSDNVVFQYNNTSFGRTNLDGMSYDIDHATSHITYQYNYSHDNEGGFMLFCPDNLDASGYGGTSDNRIHDNISINDATLGTGSSALFVHGCGGGPVINTDVYNNTFYVNDGKARPVWYSNGADGQNLTFTNNIFAKSGSGTVTFSNPDKARVDHNLIAGMAAPVGATNTTITAPIFSDPASLTPEGLRLGRDSEGIGKGITVDGQVHDYFGNVYGSSINLGAYQGEGETVISQPTPPTSIEDPNVLTNQVDRSLHPYTVYAVDSEQRGQTRNQDKENAIDGDTSTFWQTQWSTPYAPLPHYITVDLGQSVDVTGISYMPRTDQRGGRINGYAIYVSDAPFNPEHVSTPVATGHWTTDPTAAYQLRNFDSSRRGRYVTLLVTSVFAGIDAQPVTAIAELQIGALYPDPPGKLAPTSSVSGNTHRDRIMNTLHCGRIMNTLHSSREEQ